MTTTSSERPGTGEQAAHEDTPAAPTTGVDTPTPKPGTTPFVRRTLADLPTIDQKEQRRIPWLPIIALVAMTVLIVQKLWPSRIDVPRNIVGTWISLDPRYVGRELRIDSVEVVHNNGEDGESHGRITQVESSTDAEGMQVHLEYLEGDRVGQLEVLYRGGREEHLLVGEQRGVRWVRSGFRIEDGTPEAVRPNMPDSRSGSLLDGKSPPVGPPVPPTESLPPVR